MVGFLITAGTAILAGLIIGVLIKIINKHEYQDQFNDSHTYINVPSPSITDWFIYNENYLPIYISFLISKYWIIKFIIIVFIQWWRFYLLNILTFEKVEFIFKHNCKIEV